MATGTHLLPRPKSHADAQSEFEKWTGDPRRLNKFLSAGIAGVSIVCIGLLALNFRTAAQQRERIVVRLDDNGRSQVIGSTAPYKLQPNEIKYFLSQFVHDYFGRNRQTIRDDFEHAMYFLDSPLASARMNTERKDKSIEKFMYSGEDEADIVVKNIVLGDLNAAPYKAEIDLEKVFRNRAGIESHREKFTDSITFTLAKEVPNQVVLVNPLGFVVLSLREDQSFEK